MLTSALLALVKESKVESFYSEVAFNVIDAPPS